MRTPNLPLIACLSLLVASTAAWSKGRTVRIVIEGDGLPVPVEITNPDILHQFNIWNGPGVRSYGPDGVPHPPAHLDPSRSAGRFIDWPKGIQEDRPSGLRRLEVTFHIGVPRRTYVFAYEVEPEDSRGYIYLPMWKNDLISHGVEGNWLYATERWNEVMMPILAEHTSGAPGLAERDETDCTVGKGSISADGTIEFSLLDDDGNALSHWRYQAATKGYESVKEHIGPVPPGEEIEISCWPARS